MVNEKRWGRGWCMEQRSQKRRERERKESRWWGCGTCLCVWLNLGTLHATLSHTDPLHPCLKTCANLSGSLHLRTQTASIRQYWQRQSQEFRGPKLIVWALFKKKNTKLLDLWKFYEDVHRSCKHTARGPANERPGNSIHEHLSPSACGHADMRRDKGELLKGSPWNGKRAATGAEQRKTNSRDSVCYNSHLFDIGTEPFWRPRDQNSPYRLETWLFNFFLVVLILFKPNMHFK